MFGVPEKHHKLIHLNHPRNVNDHDSSSGAGTSGASINIAHVCDKKKMVILSTAIVEVLDKLGRYHKLRVLLDSGSQDRKSVV